MKAILVINDVPKSCDECPLFVKAFGNASYCKMGAKYSDKEIADEEDGNLMIYFRGCLSTKPISCPLKEITDEMEDS